MRSMCRAIYYGATFLALGAAGCNPFSMAKTGYKSIKGADAHVYPIDEVSRSQLADYGTIKLGEMNTDVGRICPPSILESIRAGFEKALAAETTKAVFSGEGKSLTLNAVCRFFKDKPLIGKEARLDLLVTLVDTESNQTLGRVYIEGLNESMRETKPEDMAAEDAAELIKYLKTAKTGQTEN